MNISMILIGGGVLVGALAFLPKGEKEREQVDYEYVEGMETAEVFDPVTGYYHELDVGGVIPLDDLYTAPDLAVPDVGFPMGEPERRLTTTGNVEVTVRVR
jgi:hypothetical protein